MKIQIASLFALFALAGGSALADVSVSNYDDLAEDFYGQTFHYNGVTYSEVNNVPGVFPDGGTFEAGGDSVESLGNEIIIENATFFYNDFPEWGSPNRAMTFGRAYVNGDNLSLGALSTVTMTPDAPADSASVEIAFYENGPWGGIVYHLDAYSNGMLVASDTRTLSDLGGRDSISTATLSVAAASFDSLVLSATFGNQFSGPRILMDNLTINTIGGGGCIGDADGDGDADSDDIVSFFGAWDTGDLAADVDNDDDTDSDDILAFFASWDAGC